MKLLQEIAIKVFKALRKLKAKNLSKAVFVIEIGKSLEQNKDVVEFLTKFRRRQCPALFINEEEALGYLGKANFQGEEWIKDAEEVCNHYFDLLGSGKTNVNESVGSQVGKGKLENEHKEYKSIAWHVDFKSGMKWDPGVLYTDTVIVKGDGSDIKVPWELSRFQHLPTLGKAYWLTDSENYAQEFVDEINDWMKSNPPLYGVNWTCPMDIAIRAVNWIWGYNFFKDSPAITEDFLLKFLTSLLVHGKHIRANLERESRVIAFGSTLLKGKLSLTVLKSGWRGINGNHYLSDIVGLVYLGVMFPEFKEAKRWREFGVKELVKEMAGQVYPDGVDYEGSISYHRLVTELFLATTLLCLKNGIGFPSWYTERLEKMFEFIMYYTKPDGMAPQINDNDDGRLHILSNYGDWDRTDHRYLLSVGAVLFARADFKQAAGEFHEEAFWLLGEEGLKKWEALPAAKEPLSSKTFPDGGFYIMREKDFYLIIDAVPADPKVPSGHKHNSRLSFEICAFGESFIIDPGAYIYTADSKMRNLFRSTAYHNTVVMDGEEQNSFNPSDVFTLGKEAKVKINAWQVNKDYDFWDGEHSGYQRLKHPVLHRRQIYFDKDEHFWLIKDILTGEGFHRFELFFHFSPLKVAFLQDDSLVAVAQGHQGKLSVIPLVTEDLQAKIASGWVSYRYGVKEEAPVLCYAKEVKTPVTFLTLLYPFLTKVEAGLLKKMILLNPLTIGTSVDFTFQ